MHNFNVNMYLDANFSSLKIFKKETRPTFHLFFLLDVCIPDRVYQMLIVYPPK